MLTVAAFYRFAPVPDPAAIVAALRETGGPLGLSGTILVAPEGVNGTIAGPAEDVAEILRRLAAEPGMEGIAPRLSGAETPPFGRFKVRLKREIVTMGQPAADPLRGTGTHVPPADWNRLVDDPATVLIDTRNAYEVSVGTFPGALDPATDRFRDFPLWWQANRDRLAGRRIAMFCTGGIRCEKATAWLVAQGVPEVYHLQGGILRYLDEIAPEDSRWQGECFVFDGRVTLGHGLTPGSATTCGACRRPLSAADRANPAFEEGVACPACAAEYGAADRARFRERHRQMALAAARGTRHLGA
ncbi:MAG: rhodanese-related sulfurtransferase [Paracoccaceae bacterium]|nr:MAG: rhodanese-related sulfurtransferase [Paracoccaceae bacterium]